MLALQMEEAHAQQSLACSAQGLGGWGCSVHHASSFPERTHACQDIAHLAIEAAAADEAVQGG